MKTKYRPRLDILYTDIKDTHGGIDQGKPLNRIPTLKYCEQLFKEQMKRKLPPNQVWTIDIEVLSWDEESNEVYELLDIIDLKEYH